MTTCQPYRDAISAMADGEVAPVSAEVLHGHLDDCSMCSAFAVSVQDLHRRVRVQEADAVPNLTASILAAVDTPAVSRARARFAQLRVVLAMAGIAQLVLLMPFLVSGHALAGHASREATIFQVALGIGFLVVAQRPARAAGLLPVAAVVALLVSAVAVADVLGGTATLLQESVHVIEIVGTFVLWAIVRDQRSAALRPIPA
jgi:predicted anti-sigma-YlaC factor YlaD